MPEATQKVRVWQDRLPGDYSADPLPLGFLALGSATWGLACLQLGWLPVQQSSLVALGLLFFTAPLQLLAGIVGFAHDQLPTATGMSLLAGIWATVGMATYTSPPGSTSKALGVFLVAAAVAMLVPAAAGVARPLGSAVMVGASLRFAVTAAYELTGRRSWEHLAGWVGLALAVLAVVVAVVLALRSSGARPGH